MWELQQEKCSGQQQQKCHRPERKTSGTLIHDCWAKDLCVLTCLWKVPNLRLDGASSLDTEELPGSAGETGGCGRGGTERHCRGVCGESSVFFLLLKCCCTDLCCWWALHILGFIYRASGSRVTTAVSVYAEWTATMGGRVHGTPVQAWQLAAIVIKAPTLLLCFLFALLVVYEWGRIIGKWMITTNKII